jgi:hypothetical protein
MRQRFADVLDSRPAPHQVGDVALRYEPSMLIGETPRPTRTWRPTAAWLCAVGCGLSLLAGALTSMPVLGMFALVLTLALSLLGAVWLEKREARRRRFVFNFLTNTLRLDFVTPIAQRAATLLVAFDEVKAIDVETQHDGLSCVVVTFSWKGERLAEALAANVTLEEAVRCERFVRLARGACGLGRPEVTAGPVDGFDAA